VPATRTSSRLPRYQSRAHSQLMAAGMLPLTAATTTRQRRAIGCTLAERHIPPAAMRSRAHGDDGSGPGWRFRAQRPRGGPHFAGLMASANLPRLTRLSPG
jgi:hypothetical protein